MAKWKCEICNTEFENFEARGFNHTIYCPLCYYKKLYNQQKAVLDKIKEYIKEWREDDGSGSYGTLELLELLEEIE